LKSVTGAVVPSQPAEGDSVGFFSCQVVLLQDFGTLVEDPESGQFEAQLAHTGADRPRRMPKHQSRWCEREDPGPQLCSSETPICRPG
jgi:hypothetical protein